MPISPDTILFVIRGLMRIGTAAQKEIEASIRSKDIQIPPVLMIDITPTEELNYAILRARLDTDPDYIQIRRELDVGTPGAEERLREFAAARGLIAELESTQEQTGLLTIKQWHEDVKKNIPMARIGLAIVETALDYVAVNPAVLGIGSNGERFVSAMAGAINEILPNSDKEGILTAESLFTERSLAIVMHAGLGALQEHVEDNIGEEHLRDLAASMIKPLHDHFDPQSAVDADRRISKRSLVQVRELMLGPMFQAGVKALARNQEEILGKKFKPGSALGASVETIFVEIAKDDASIRDLAKRGTWVRVYGAVLDLAIARPELFGGESDDADSKFGRDLVKSLGTVLKDMTPPLTAAVAATVAVESVGVLSRNTAVLFDGHGPWRDVTRNAASSVLGSLHAGLKEGLKPETDANGTITFDTDKVLASVFSEKQVGDLVRIVLDQAAKTPAMITGDDQRDEVKTLVAGIARAVSDSNRNLLSGDDWLEVAAIIAEEAAKNPGALFKIDGTGIEDEFAVALVKDILAAAAADFRARGRADGAVLFGDTLKAVINDTLKAVTENAVLAATNQKPLIDFINKINALQAAEGFGRTVWLRIFRTYYKTILFASDGVTTLGGIPDPDLLALIGAPE